MLYAGIDPGVKGGVVVIDDQQRAVFTHVTPIIGKEYDIPEMYSLLRGIYAMGAAFCCIEKGQSMPGDSGRSAWKMGFGHGLWQMALTVVGIRYHVCPPQVWQRALGIPKGADTKIHSVLIAKREVADLNLLRTVRSKNEDHNIADATNLAVYARRRWTSGDTSTEKEEEE